VQYGANKKNRIMDINKTYLGDCLELMPKHIEDKSIDMIFCDLPYGTTKCKWDSVIDLHKLWSEYERVIKDNGAIVLFAQQPFTTTLIGSNIKLFKYNWVWEKERLTNIAQVKKRAGKTVEDICVFYKKQCTYNPQMVKHTGKKRANKVKNGKMGFLTDSREKKVKEYIDTGYRYPTQVLSFKRDILTSNLHPTQKPLALIEYMIKTYTNEGDLILDNTCGSGTTGLGAKNLKRNYIMMEQDPKYYEIACKRVLT
jgi:site-specific DNA-methyltransferase (adenine-specific)